MAGKNKYYVVFKGRNVGIYEDWIQCHEQVVRFSGCAYEGFNSLQEAEAAWLKFMSDANGHDNMDEHEPPPVVPPPAVPPPDLVGMEAWIASGGPSSSTNISMAGLSLNGNLLPSHQCILCTSCTTLTPSHMFNYLSLCAH